MSFTGNKITDEAKALELLGDNEYRVGNFQVAHSFYLKAYDINRNPGDLRLYFKITETLFSTCIQLYQISLSDLKIPKKCSKLCLKMMQGRKYDQILLDKLNLIKLCYYIKAKKDDKAIQLLHFFNSIESNFNSKIFFETYIGISRFLLMNNEIEEALKTLKKCSKVNKNILKTNYQNQGFIYYLLGGIYFDLNNNEKSSKNYIKFLNLYERELFTDIIFVSEGYLYLALLYVKINSNEKAIENFEKCKNISKNMENPDLDTLKLIYHNLSELYNKMNDKQKSFEEIEKYVEVLQLISPDHPELESKYIFIVESYCSLNNFQKQLEYYKKFKKLMIRKLGPKHEILTQVYFYIGVLYNLNNMPQKVSKYYNKLLVLLENTPDGDKNKLLYAYFYFGLLSNSLGENKAWGYFKKCRKILRENPGLINEKFTITYIKLGKYYLIRKAEKAVKCLEEYHIFRKDLIKYKYNHLIDLYITLGLAYKNIEEKEKAIEEFEKCRQELNKDSLNNSLFYEKYFNLGKLFSDLKENSKAVDCYNKAIEIYKKNNNLFTYFDTVCEAYMEIIELLAKMNDKEKIVFYCKDFKGKLKKIMKSDHSNLELSYYYLGCLGEIANKINKAQKYFKESIELARKSKNYVLLSRVYMKLGILYFNEHNKNNENIKKTFEYFKLCLKLKIKFKLYDTKLAEVYLYIGKLYLIKNKPIKAEKMFENCRKLSEKILTPNDYFIASVYYCIGLMHFSNAKGAIEFLEKSRSITENIYSDRHTDLLLIYKHLSIEYYHINNYKKSIKYSEKCKNLINSFSSPDKLSLMEINSFLFKLYIDTNDFEKLNSLNMEILQSSFFDSLSVLFSKVFITKFSLFKYNVRFLNSIEEIIGSNHQSLQSFYLEVGNLLIYANLYNEALVYYEKYMNISKKFFKPNSISLANAYFCLGNTYISLKNKPKAIKFFEKSQQLLENYYPKNYFALFQNYELLERLYQEINEHTKAAENFRKRKYFEQNYKKQLDLGKNNFIQTLNIFTQILQKLINSNQNIIQNIISFLSNIPSINYDMISMVYDTIESVKTSYFSVKLKEDFEDNTTGFLNEFSREKQLFNYGLIYDLSSDFKNAIKYYEKCKEEREKKMGENHSDLASIYNLLGNVYFEVGEKKNALVYYEKCRNIKEKLDPMNIDLVIIYNCLFYLYSDSNEPRKAKEFLNKSLEIKKKSQIVQKNAFFMIVKFFYNIEYFISDLNFMKIIRNLYSVCKKIKENKISRDDPYLKLDLNLHLELISDKLDMKNKFENSLVIIEFIEYCLFLPKCINNNRQAIIGLSEIFEHIDQKKNINASNLMTDNIKKYLLNYFNIPNEKKSSTQHEKSFSLVKHKRDKDYLYFESDKKLIVPFKNCPKFFPNIYNKSLSYFKNIDKKKKSLKIFEKKYKGIYGDWKYINSIYKEIKFLKMILKKNPIVPSVYYFRLIKTDSANILLGVNDCGDNLKNYVANPNNHISEREAKILLFNIMKAYNTLYENKIVHSDVSPYNILVKSPEKVFLCDFSDSFICTEVTENNPFPTIWPKKNVTVDFLSPEKKSWSILFGSNPISYDPFKSDVFSIGLCFLNSFGVDIKNLNDYDDSFYGYIYEILMNGYDNFVKDSLRRFSFKLLRNRLQKNIDEIVDEFPLESLREILKNMLEVDMAKRPSIRHVYKKAESMGL
ncbi:hypothetical protein SteCoe_35043 [Stentor coeruleus]|uniref:Protein kinase domain-containing protein n=1 Tax=Stentor coeruleus TaxID=5963 RepID=A0A1R2AT74_9CILI|nr:hypothetical protein SteCoe_35043 [Stentor coeruleus]